MLVQASDRSRLRRVGHGPRRPPTRRAARSAVSTSRRPASSIPTARPENSSLGSTTRTSWPSVAQRARISPASRRRPDAWSSRGRRRARAARRCSSTTLRSSGDAAALRSSRQVPPASGGPGPGDIQADARHHGRRRGRRTRPRPGPSQLGAAHQQVIRPFQQRPRPRPPRRRRRGRPGPAAPVQRCRSSGSQSGRSSTEASRLAPGGDSQRRSSRPRPGRLVVGHRHQAFGLPPDGLARAGRSWSNRSRRTDGPAIPRPTWHRP